MIELRNIKKSYGNVVALDGVNLVVENAKICMLLGPSGCGKSTLLRLINRLIEPDSGEIFIKRRSNLSYRIEELRRNMGYAIQGVGLFPHMTVGENISVVPKLYKWEESRIKARVEELLDLVGLPSEYAFKLPRELSGGEAQRVGVARALGADPEFLLMDEPFGALDPVNRKRLQQEFLQIQKRLKKTVVFVTHDINEAAIMADQLVIMKEGKIVGVGTPEEIACCEDEAIVGFLGNGFGLELLERHSLIDNLALFERWTHQVNADDLLRFDKGSTMKEMMASFLLSERTLFSVEGVPGVYLYSTKPISELLLKCE
ncbi:MAG: ABC transporter ATP-binding protein [Clostridia bacterium]|nr:ABC transporter ATP-binding protein [Clostridia bacterium]